MHLAPAIDVRPKARVKAGKAPPPKPLPPPDELDRARTAPFVPISTFAFPVEERTPSFGAGELDSEKTLEDEAPMSAESPMTVDYERARPRERVDTLRDDDPSADFDTGKGWASISSSGNARPGAMPAGWENEPDRTRTRSSAPRTGLELVEDSSVEDSDHMTQRDALVLDIAAIGTVDERADRESDRAVSARATLARARALRFRLALLDVWPLGQTPRPIRVAAGSGRTVGESRPLHLDLTLDCALLAAIADGAPTPPGVAPGSSTLPFVGPLAAILLGHRGDLPRTALRDRGAAAIARITIMGWKGSLDQLTKLATTVPVGVRKVALEVAARIALVPPMNSHRLGALHELERALALPTGSAASAIDDARQGR